MSLFSITWDTEVKKLAQKKPGYYRDLFGGNVWSCGGTGTASFYDICWL